MSEAVQPTQNPSENQDERKAADDKKGANTDAKPVSESQPPTSTETTNSGGDDESSSDSSGSDDEDHPEGWRSRGKPSKPVGSQAKPGVRK
ncbi:unnamed protein product [Peniophora sp. CBMAI 1063]|nr:unnamed protein product [Peniophora sp. CBMAI 1063]